MGLRRLPRLLLVGALGASLLAGSPAAAQRSSPAPDPQGAGLEGPRWQLTEYRTGDGLVPVLPGVRTDLTFWAGFARGNTGCAPFTVAYVLDGAAVTPERASAPAEDCDPETREVHDALLANLADVASWQADGAELVLLDGAGDERLRFTSASVPVELDISPWRLARIADGSGRLQPVIDGSIATAEFLPGGRVVGANGCGGYLGSYRSDGTDLRIRDLASRIGECDPALAAQAEAVIQALPKAVQTEVTPTGLMLLDAAGERLLSWVPAPALVGTVWTPIAIADADDAEPKQLQGLAVAFGSSIANGRTVCKGWSGPYRRSGLAVTLESVTRSSPGRCKPPKLENAFLGALGKVAAFSLRGGSMDLLDGDGNPVMQLQPQPPLTGTPWQLTGLDQRSGLKPPIGRGSILATFSSSGSISGNTGCNEFRAAYRTDGASISIPRDEIRPGARRCSPPPVGQQEKAFLDALAKVDNFLVVPDELRLYEGDRVLMTFGPPA
jgi:heat shock protein HslJ